MIKRELQVFLTSIMFFTRIPVPNTLEYSKNILNKSVKYISIVGWIIGGLAAGIFYITYLVLPLSLSILLSMAFTVFITGAFHEDGFADLCDGFGGGYTKHQIVEIMKDSRIGAFGVIGIFFILVTKFYTLQAISPHLIPIILILGHTVSRASIPFIIYKHKYVGDLDNNKSKPIGNQISRKELIFAWITGLLPILLIPSWWYLVPLLLMILVIYLVMRYMYRRIGGYTGDGLGAIQQVAEVSFYIGTVILIHSFNNI